MRRAASVLTAFLLAAAISAPASAQEGFRLGVEGGINIANISTDPDVDSESLTGLRGGVTATYGLGADGVFALKTGALYSEKGTTLPASVLGVEAEFKAAYLEVPLLAAYNVPVDGAFRPQLYGGGLLGIEMSCDAEATGSGASASCSDAGVPTKSTDFGLLFGGSLGYAVSESAVLRLNGGYNLGLSNILDAGSGSIKNRAFQIGAGVEFAL